MVHYVAFLDSAMEIRPIRLGVIRAHCLAGSSGFVVPPCRQYPFSLSSQIEEVGEFRARVLFRVEAMIVVSKLVVVFDSHAVAVDELTVAIFLCQAIEIAASEHGVELGPSRAHTGWGGVARLFAGAFVAFPIGALTIHRAVSYREATTAALKRRGK